jgi:hypothetical protein
VPFADRSGRLPVYARLVAGAALVLMILVASLGPAHAASAPSGGTSLASEAASDTTGSADPTSSVTSSTVASSSAVATTGCFARMLHTSLRIHYPAGPSHFIAVGFHQADNKKAVRFVPSLKCYKRAKASRVRSLIKRKKIKLFQQPLRGRGSSNFSAADCAVKRGTAVVAPVDGVVTNVRTYKLYGYVTDYRLEIKPDGNKHLRVVMLHITGVKVRKGDRVVGGVTPVAVVRKLPFTSTINRFIPVKPIDHVHIQVNLDTFKAPY